MNIYSLRNTGSDYSSLFSIRNTSNSSSVSVGSTTGSSSKNIVYSAYGDSFEFSGNTQSVDSKYMTYGPPRGGPNGTNDPIKTFLDKVADGTVTDEDIQNMQATLQQVQQSTGAIPTAPPDGGLDEIKTFLDKVANGTVTNDDLTNMQTTLQQMQTEFISESSSAGNHDDPIKTFLDKVADGTVTEDDLKNMQATLESMQQQSGSEGLHRHRPSESDRTNPTGTSLDAAGNTIHTEDLIRSFLDKVSDGSVTDEDLSNMQGILLQTQQQYGI